VKVSSTNKTRIIAIVDCPLNAEAEGRNVTRQSQIISKNMDVNEL